MEERKFYDGKTASELAGELLYFRDLRDRLHDFIILNESGRLGKIPGLPLRYYKKQEKALNDYIFCLELRIEIENIDIFQEGEEIAEN